MKKYVHEAEAQIGSGEALNLSTQLFPPVHVRINVMVMAMVVVVIRVKVRVRIHWIPLCVQWFELVTVAFTWILIEWAYGLWSGFGALGFSWGGFVRGGRQFH